MVYLDDAIEWLILRLYKLEIFQHKPCQCIRIIVLQHIPSRIHPFQGVWGGDDYDCDPGHVFLMNVNWILIGQTRQRLLEVNSETKAEIFSCKKSPHFGARTLTKFRGYLWCTNLTAKMLEWLQQTGSPLCHGSAQPWGNTYVIWYDIFHHNHFAKENIFLSLVGRWRSLLLVGVCRGDVETKWIRNVLGGN